MYLRKKMYSGKRLARGRGAAAGTGGDVHHRLDVGGRRGVPYRI